MLLPGAAELATKLRAQIGKPATPDISIGPGRNQQGTRTATYLELPGITHTIIRKASGDTQREWSCPHLLDQHCYPTAANLLEALDYLAQHPGMPLPPRLRPGRDPTPQARSPLVF